MQTEDTLFYRVSLVTTRTMGMIEMLQDLMASKNNRVDSNLKKVLNLIEGADETITLSEAITSALIHNAQTEAVTVSESLTAQSIDYDVDFVAGPYVWNGEGSGDNKRLFITNGSRLG